ncbi:beta strand repeat-containing protein, partial [Muriicola sp.]|uniref:beta strand repeat-containing protein n=1 Tax=Muriicola sp. TaxID=2020856 RepID=UPI003C73DDDD
NFLGVDVDSYYNVDITPIGAGDITIDVAAVVAQAVSDAQDNTVATTATTIFDNVPPTISIGAPSVASTSAGPVSYTITYTGASAVSLVPGDITLNTTGTATGTVAVTGTGNVTRTVTISGITGDGTLGITIAAATATDGINTAPGAGPSTTFTVDNTGPTGYTVTINQDPINTSNETSISFTFSGAQVNSIYNFTFTSTGGGTPVTGTGTIVSPGETIPGIDLSGLGDGTINLSVTLTDALGNTGSAATDSVTKVSDAISINDVTQVELNSGTSLFIFTVSVDGGGNAASNINFTYNTANGTATAGSDYVAVVGGTGTITAGTNSTTISVTVNGDTTVEGNETFLVNLSAPVNATINDAQGQGTITNDDTAGVIITPTSGLVTTEDGESDIFTITLTAQPTANVIIQLSSSDTSEGTVPASVTILPGQWNTGVDVIVTGVDDAILDGDIAFTIVTGNISSGDAAFNALTGASVADVSVTNTDDDTAAVTIADVGGLENGGPITVTAILDNATPGGFTVDVSTSDGSAVAGSDYSAIVSQTLTFVGTPGEQQTFTVSPIGDTNVEANETLTISMSNLASTILPVNITDVATVTINNDDSATLSIDDPTPIAEGNSGIQTIVFTVTLGQSDPNNPISVNYLISGGNEDTNTGTLNFIAGDIDLDRTISVTTNGDTVVEGDETISVTLSNPSINAILTKSIGSS